MRTSGPLACLFSCFSCIALTTVFSPSAASAQAAAQPSADAEAAITQGLELRRQRKNREALQLFQKAYQLSPSPRARAQIGMAEQALGQWAEAERDLEEALGHNDDVWITQRRAVLAESLVVIRGHLGGVTIDGEPSGAAVEFDGEPVGVIPLAERHVTAGEVVVTVRAPGFVPVTRKLTVTPGALAAELFRLKRVESDGPAGRAPAVTPPPTLAVPPAVTPPGPPTESADSLRVATWATAIGAGVALLTGATFLILAEKNVHNFDGHCFVDNKTNAVMGGGDCNDLYDGAHRNRVIGYVSLGVGVAAAATSAVLFTRSRAQNSVSAPSPAHALACLPAAGAGLACAWRF